MNRRRSAQLIKQILQKTVHYYHVAHKPSPYKPGQRIPYAGRVYDEQEICNLVDAALEFWLTSGRFAGTFEENLAAFLGVKHCSLVSSGSSANLLAFMALTSPKLGQRQIRRGDEVITVAAAFPTTVAPIVQYGAVPVFVDISLPTYNADVDEFKKALSKKTKAVILAHTLGNPFDLASIKKFCVEHGLWLVEDNCDALGSRYRYEEKWHFTGTIGDMGTSSFYPPHHMTMGEGGAVYTGDPSLKRIIDSMRDWGRDCCCPSGDDNTCRRRFSQQFGELPRGYDHKYVYSHFGFNFKATDLQAAIGCAQLEKLAGFIQARKKNWTTLKNGLKKLEEYFILPEPTKNSDPSWFGFLLTVRERCGFTRDDIVQHMETKGIQTRMLFAGNLLRHPCFDEVRNRKKGFRRVGKLATTDRVMRDSFWIGVYPGLTQTMTDYVVEVISNFVLNPGRGKSVKNHQRENGSAGRVYGRRTVQ
jgi:CDP-6-deoxy-D-xylo-4-hexulose-3-dehydrase